MYEQGRVHHVGRNDVWADWPERDPDELACSEFVERTA